MKRVQAGCICQTLLFSQKPDAGYTKEQALEINRQEVEHYKAHMAKMRTRYQITESQEQADGSILLRVRKEYNPTVSVDEYFSDLLLEQPQ